MTYHSVPYMKWKELLVRGTHIGVRSDNIDSRYYVGHPNGDIYLVDAYTGTFIKKDSGEKSLRESTWSVYKREHSVLEKKFLDQMGGGLNIKYQALDGIRQKINLNYNEELL